MSGRTFFSFNLLLFSFLFFPFPFHSHFFSFSFVLRFFYCSWEHWKNDTEDGEAIAFNYFPVKLFPFDEQVLSSSKNWIIFHFPRTRGTSLRTVKTIIFVLAQRETIFFLGMKLQPCRKMYQLLTFSSRSIGLWMRMFNDARTFIMKSIIDEF